MPIKKKELYALQVAHVSHNYVDAETDYYGNFSALAPSTTARTTSIPIPKKGNIISAHLYFFVGTVGSSEDMEFYIRVNNTTDYAISTAVKFDAAATQYVIVSNTALNIPVVAGDVIQIKVVCPTWVTNPLQVRHTGVILVSC